MTMAELGKRAIIRTLQTLLLLVFLLGLFALTFMLWHWAWSYQAAALFVAGLLASRLAWALERRHPSSS